MEQKYEETIIEVLHILRGMAKLKQREVAEKLGIHSSAYWKIENGLVTLNLTQFKQICSVFGFSHVKVYYIIDLINEMRKSNENLDIRIQIFKSLYLDDWEPSGAAYSGVISKKNI